MAATAEGLKKLRDDQPDDTAGSRRRPAPGTGPSPIIRSITGRAAPMHILMAELLVGAILVGIRAVADYEVQTTGTITGKVAHPNTTFGPLPILAALTVCFFLLSFLAVGTTGSRAKVAVAAGAVLDLALAMKSVTEIKKVAGVFGGSFGTANTAPPAPTTLVTQTPVSSKSPTSSASGSKKKTTKKAKKTTLPAFTPHKCYGKEVTVFGAKICLGI